MFYCLVSDYVLGCYCILLLVGMLLVLVCFWLWSFGNFLFMVSFCGTFSIFLTLFYLKDLFLSAFTSTGLAPLLLVLEIRLIGFSLLIGRLSNEYS